MFPVETKILTGKIRIGLKDDVFLCEQLIEHRQCCIYRLLRVPYGGKARSVIQRSFPAKSSRRVFHDEAHPGFSELIYQPHPDARAGWLQARLETRNGVISACWRCEGDQVRYELQTPVPAVIRLNGEEKRVAPGRYTFWGPNKAE